MIILIPDLGKDTSPEKLCEFVAFRMKNVWPLPGFRRRGRLEKCEILRIKDQESNRVQYQGLAYVDDDMAGAALIRQLNGCHLEGVNLRPRVYHSRSAVKERRVNLSDSDNLAIVNRRRTDRRRCNLLIEKVVSPPASSSSI